MTNEQVDSAVAEIQDLERLRITRIVDDITIQVAEGTLENRFTELSRDPVAAVGFRLGAAAVLTEILERLESQDD